MGLEVVVLEFRQSFPVKEVKYLHVFYLDAVTNQRGHLNGQRAVTPNDNVLVHTESAPVFSM